MNDQDNKEVLEAIGVLAQQVQETHDGLHLEMGSLKTDLRTEMKSLGSELRTEMKSLGSELRTEMKSLGSELRTEMGNLKIELRSEMADLRHDMTDFRQHVDERFDGVDNLIRAEDEKVDLVAEKLRLKEIFSEKDVKDILSFGPFPIHQPPDA